MFNISDNSENLETAVNEISSGDAVPKDSSQVPEKVLTEVKDSSQTSTPTVSDSSKKKADSVQLEVKLKESENTPWALDDSVL